MRGRSFRRRSSSSTRRTDRTIACRAAGYGSILSNDGVTLAVSNVVSKAKTIDLSARLKGTLKGTLKGAVTCAGCASGGPTVTFELQVDLTNVPRPDA